MFFTRTHNFHFSVPKDDLKNRLLGKHVQIHNLDFEILDTGEQNLSIVPHAEQVESIKTLPITDVEIQEDGDTTRVVVTSSIRPIDIGGPILILIICSMLIGASIVLMYVGGERVITYSALGLGVGILALFMIRMQMGYFDYVRKIRAYVKSKAMGTDVNMSFAQA
jgi:hypothetical protein